MVKIIFFWLTPWNLRYESIFNKHFRSGFRYIENHNLALDDMLDNIDLKKAIK